MRKNVAANYATVGRTEQIWACLNRYAQYGWTAILWRSSNVFW